MANQIEDPGRSGWWTAEFGAALISIAANLIAFAVLLGFVPPSDQQSLTDKATAVITLFGVIAGNMTAAWKFIGGRERIKVQAFKTMEATSTPLTIKPDTPSEPTTAPVIRGRYN